MSHDSDKNGTNDQSKSRGSAKVELAQLIRQPPLHRVWQEPHHRRFYVAMEEPKHQQRKWKCQNKSAEQTVSEPAARTEAEKIFEIRSESANQQRGKYRACALKRQSCGTVR